MPYSNRPSKRAIPGIMPLYPIDPQERALAIAYTDAFIRRKEEKRRRNMERTRKGLK